VIKIKKIYILLLVFLLVFPSSTSADHIDTTTGSGSGLLYGTDFFQGITKMTDGDHTTSYTFSPDENRSNWLEAVHSISKLTIHAKGRMWVRYFDIHQDILLEHEVGTSSTTQEFSYTNLTGVTQITLSIPNDTSLYQVFEIEIYGTPITQNSEQYFNDELAELWEINQRLKNLTNVLKQLFKPVKVIVIKRTKDYSTLLDDPKNKPSNQPTVVFIDGSTYFNSLNNPDIVSPDPLPMAPEPTDRWEIKNGTVTENVYQDPLAVARPVGLADPVKTADLVKTSDPLKILDPVLVADPIPVDQIWTLDPILGRTHLYNLMNFQTSESVKLQDPVKIQDPIIQFSGDWNCPTCPTTP
jgi:hypothetical protein